MTAIRVRQAESSDAEPVARLLGELGYPTAVDDVPARIDRVNMDGGAVYVAVDAEARVVGVTSLTKQYGLHAAGPVAYIMALVTSSDARGTGVGRALVEEAEKWARAAGCVRLSVTSAERRSDAHAFYPKCGLPYTGRRFSKSLTPQSISQGSNDFDTNDTNLTNAHE